MADWTQPAITARDVAAFNRRRDNECPPAEMNTGCRAHGGAPLARTQSLSGNDVGMALARSAAPSPDGVNGKAVASSPLDPSSSRKPRKQLEAGASAPSPPGQ